MARAQQVVRRHDLLRRSPGDAFPGHQQGVREMRPDLIEVVKHGGDRPAFAVPALDQEKEILAGPPIDRGERLIEQDQLAILNDQAGKEDALELAG